MLNFIIGTFVGFMFGFFIAAILAAAKRSSGDDSEM